MSALAAVLLLALPQASRPAERDLAELLEPIRAKHDLPALAAALVEGDTVTAIGATGVRRVGSPERATVDDLWHMGSCTKAMTATLIARHVERGTIRWTTTIGEVLGGDVKDMDPAWRPVTVEQLLSHRGGVPSNLDRNGLWARLWQREGPPIEQRRRLYREVLQWKPEPPGFLYSNAGYAIAGAMLERLAGAPWETLIRRDLFDPLGMKSAGFGAPGKPGSVDQPRGHVRQGNAWVPVDPGPDADNPPAIGPAGTVHVALRDWARFVSLHLRDRSLAKLHEVPGGGEEGYALGWGVTRRPWGDGAVIRHAGSNTMWYCEVWAAPKKGFATLVATNAAGTEAPTAVDEVASALIASRAAR
ncbi:MAG TPA: serine hydrolase domain-containing protein [Planctomycetota bacterium]|nr:serine hydrolase domain-containing protein [Planctomycetota bacterium]